MHAYKFSNCASAEKPDNEMTRLLEKAQDEKPMARAEKDRIANILYGTFSGHSSTYRLAGWAWGMAQCLRRILVSYNYDRGHFETYYAADKTALRGVLSSVNELVYADK